MEENRDFQNLQLSKLRLLPITHKKEKICTAEIKVVILDGNSEHFANARNRLNYRFHSTRAHVFLSYHANNNGRVCMKGSQFIIFLSLLVAPVAMGVLTRPL